MKLTEKQIENIKEFVESKLEEKPFHPVAFFAQSLAVIWDRQNDVGISIGEIAKCFKAQFTQEELKILINELSIQQNPA